MVFRPATRSWLILCMTDMVELRPIRVEATIVEVTDMMIRADIPGRIGVVMVPRRHVYTDKELAVGQKVEFYFSHLQVLDE